MSKEPASSDPRPPVSSEQRIVLGAVLLLGLLLVAFYLTSCRGVDSTQTVRAEGAAARTAGTTTKTVTMSVAVKRQWRRGRCTGPWLDQRARDRVFDSLKGPAKQFAYIPSGLFNGSHGICFR